MLNYEDLPLGFCFGDYNEYIEKYPSGTSNTLGFCLSGLLSGLIWIYKVTLFTPELSYSAMTYGVNISNSTKML